MRANSEGPVILAAFANDAADATHFLRNLSKEAQRIQTAWEPAQKLCQLILLPSATLDQILDAFQKYRDRVVMFHYAGHANGFELLLESASGGVHRVGAQGLASFLGQQQGLQLVFLNGCSTERQAEDLLNAGVGCVIATTQSIDDGVATDFSARFYQGIVTGAALQSAFAEATGSAQASSGGSIDRLIRRKEEQVATHVEGRWPWLLKFKPGAERVAQWSLPEAAGDPLFGLPPVPQRELPESPYRHLYRFEAEHAEVFFGRGHEVRELYQRVTASDAAPVVLFYGPSGVGKSSLLDAGLIPRLAGKNEVRYVRRDPALGLGETLRSAFPKEVQNLSRRDAWMAAEKSLGRPLVIVLDQVEEVFTKPHPQQPQELAEFVQLLRRIFLAPDHRLQGKLILGFRKEWFAEIDELLADAQVPRSRIFLERLSRNGAIEAITGPVDDLRLASQYQLKIEDGLPEIIADDLLADPDTPVAPTLQILLTRMWSEATRRNREHPTFDADLYQSLHRNGILLDDFLRQQTEQIRSRLPRAVETGFLLDLLEFHTTAIGTSAEHPLSVLEQTYAEQAKSGLLSQTLKLCEELYLLTFSGTAIPAPPPHPGPLPPSHVSPVLHVARGGEGAETHRSSRLLHDTLAPLIRARHEDSDLPGQRSRRILNNRLVDWLEGKTGIPLDSKDLKEVESALEGTRSWSPNEQRLVTASREERASKRKWSRIFKGLGAAALVAIVIAGGVAYWQRGEAIAQKNVADGQTELAKQETAKALLAQADADQQAATARKELALSERRMGVLTRDLDQEFIKSAHHFAASAATTDEPQLAATMSFAAGQSITGVRLLDTLEHRDFVHEAWLLKTGDLVTWSGEMGNATVLTRWPARGAPVEIALVKHPARRVVLAPDESVIVVELPTEEIQAFDLSTGQEQKPPEGLSLAEYQPPTWDRSEVKQQLDDRGMKFTVPFTPQIYGVSFAVNQPHVLIWTAKTVPMPFGFLGVVDNPTGFAQIWNMEVRAPVTPPLKLGTPLRGAKFVDGDQQLLMWAEDGRVMLWDVSRTRRIENVSKSDSAPSVEPQYVIALPPEGSRQVSWSSQGFWLQETATGEQHGSLYRLPGVFGVQPSRDGNKLLGWGGSTGQPGSGSGGFVSLWDTRTQSKLIPDLRHQVAVGSARYNQSERRILTSTWVAEPGSQRVASVHLWDVETQLELIPAIPNLNNFALSAEFGPDDQSLTVQTYQRVSPENITYVTYTHDISPDPTLDPKDPRIDIVIRTGTYVTRLGELKFLNREDWKQLRDSPRRPTYEEWIQRVDPKQ